MVPDLEANAPVVMVGPGSDPAAPQAGEHAELRGPARPPARPGMDGAEGLVELPARVLLPRQIPAHAQPHPIAQRMLVLAARPHREPHAGGGQLLLVAAERQVEDVDDLVVGGRADVAVRRERRPGVH